MANLSVLKKWFEASTPRQKLTAGLLGFSLLATGLLLALGGVAETPGGPLAATPLYFAGVFAKLVGVLLLIVACALLFRRWFQIGPQGGAVRQLRLLETVRLSPRQALHLVAVGDQQLLIGATDGAIALLTPVESRLNLVPAPAARPEVDFGSLLHSLSLPLQGKEALRHD
jgi:flagellar biosynthetic protein FliO